MKIKRIVSMMLFVTLFCYSTVLYAETIYYVQSAKAKVMSGAFFKAKVIAEVGRGFKLPSTGREGSWVKVRVDGKDGYVSALVLSLYPPIEKAGIIKAEDAEIRQGVRRRASSYTSAAAARGLAQDDRRRLSKEEKANYDDLEKMESFIITPEEIGRFMEGGKL